MYHRPFEGRETSGRKRKRQRRDEEEEKSVKARRRVLETREKEGSRRDRRAIHIEGGAGTRVARPRGPASLDLSRFPSSGAIHRISLYPLRRAPPGSYDPSERGACVTHASSCSHTRFVGLFARTCVVLPILIGHRRCRRVVSSLCILETHASSGVSRIEVQRRGRAILYTVSRYFLFHRTSDSRILGV